MIDTMTVAYEGIDEVKATRENGFNMKYQHSFSYRNGSLT